MGVASLTTELKEIVFNTLNWMELFRNTGHRLVLVHKVQPSGFVSYSIVSLDIDLVKRCYFNNYRKPVHF